MIDTSRIAGWPRPVWYVYFLISSLTFKGYNAWCSDGEPNPFLAVPIRNRQTNVQEIADIFAMTAREREAFGKVPRGF